MTTKRNFVLSALLLPVVVCDARANLSLLFKIGKALKSLGKPALAIGTSAIAGIASAKALKEIEHQHDDSPMLLVTTYYVLLNERRTSDAAACWEDEPLSHIKFMKTFESILISDIKEINRTPARADIFISLQARQYARNQEEWKGNIILSWHETTWLIRSMQISKVNA